MSQEPQKNDYRALLQQALVSLEQMETKLRAAQDAQHEPIAIIGMGLRFPGGAIDAASFWQLLHDGVDAIREVPADRWNADQFYDPDPDAVGKMYTRWGGFLEAVDQFDPQFFGISPREAVSMDPQQRLLLETSWEALENAGQASSKLAGSQTGVFVGMVGSDYANLKMISGGINDVDAYFGTGISRSIAAGRIAYTFGLHGPAVAVDTACSSSLVAAHQACQSLRLKECDMALAGGVNIILEPSGSISTSRSRMMSLDGRCKTFDATADGYVRSEGCAMLVLKRLSDAQKDGDNILAVIRGTATNQDGRSNGLTAPNGKAQEAVIRAALKDAKLKPADVQYVETHGTGTSLGDPIEVRALGAVFAGGRSADNPLMIGSVKTNVGHLEAAAGIVGLVKVVLGLQNKTVPPHIHLNELNPYIPWKDLPITVPTQPTTWSVPSGAPRIAGLSSFGFSGTNAHMILAEAPAFLRPEAKFERTCHLFTLSAKSEPALQELAGKHEAYLEKTPPDSLADVVYGLNTGRSHFTHRLALTAASLAQAQEKLAAWKRAGETPGLFTGTTSEGGKPEVVFLFTGQGAQYAGMARQLFETQPEFRRTMQQCEELLRPRLERPLLSVVYPQGQGDEQLIHQTAYTQPVLFALEYSLARLWQSWGVQPSVVLGHSVGEYVAACIAGIFSLEDGLKLVAARGRLMQSLPGGGVMVSVFADETRVRTTIAAHTDKVSIAAVNGPAAVVISGAESAVGAVVAALQKEGIKSQALQVSHAFHSPLMDPILHEFEQVATSIQYHSPQIGLISNIDGRLITDDTASNAAYWREHVRQTVRFADGIKTLRDQGYRFFLEVGPNPTLLGMARRCEPVNPNSIWLPSLRSGRSDWEQLLESLAQLYISGQDVDWDRFESPYTGQRKRLELPTYPFQRERYWLDFESSSGTFETRTDHPLLGSRLSTAMPVFQKQLSASNPAYLGDHRIQGLAILPAAAYIETAYAAAKQALPGEAFSLQDISIHEALPLAATTERVMQLLLTNERDGTSFQFFSREGDSQEHPWHLHANGRIRSQAMGETPAGISLDELRTRLSETLPVDAYYQHLAAVGADYGPAFRGIREIWRTDGEALGRIELPESLDVDLSYTLHPALLDACFQLLGAAVPGAANLDGAENHLVYVPVGMQAVDIHTAAGTSVYCHVQIRASERPGAKTLSGDVIIFDDSGRLIAKVSGLLLQQIDQQSLRRAMQANIEDWCYAVEWREQSRGTSTATSQGSGSWLVFADESQISQSLAAGLRAQGRTCYLVDAGRGFARKGPDQWEIDPSNAEDFKQLLTDLRAEGKQPLRGIVHLWSLRDSLDDQIDLEALHSIQVRNLASVLHLVQSLAKQDGATPTLYLITRGAQAVSEEETVNAAVSPLWGFANVIALEQPDLRCKRIDLDPLADATSLLDEIWQADDEDQIAIRGDKRFVARLVRAQITKAVSDEDQPVELTIQERGMLDHLTLQPVARRQPGPGEVEIEVHATGLNFRDVLNALGMYPGDPGSLGSECAGRVVRLGESVQEFQVGDAVIALANHSFGSYVTVATSLVVPKPANLTFEEAATIPIAFLTADYALNTLAKMKAGDRVLIHAAAGGVGMAAVQLARRAGAEIFGTAGSEEKRALLQPLGVHHIFNSRTLEFAEGILSLTNGEGVDIVLNSLAGDFIAKSFSVLKEKGCFVEIGKTGIWNQEQAQSLKKDIAYFVLYLGEILEKDPHAIQKMLLDLLADFEKGVLKPLPQTLFPLENAAAAFRFMAQARHIGKIVITQAHAEPTLTIRSDATHLITGGFGGLGLVVAQWLANRGARHLVLLGRSDPSGLAREKLNELESAGVEIYVCSADVAQRNDLEKVLSHISEHMPPLRGVIHAAGVLDDGILAEQTWSRFTTVMAPKVDGAWNLHTLTHNTALDFFVLFSAGASLLGSAGQSNYAAANSFLDGLAHYRRSCGLPALSINWGAWAEVGMASRLGPQSPRRWALQGIEHIKPADGVRVLERLLNTSSVQVAVLPIHWQAFSRQGNDIIRPFLRALVKPEIRGAETQRDSGRRSFLEQLKATPPEEQLKFLSAHITAEVNKVLGLDAKHSPNPRQGFTDIGLDSLMAVELSNRLQKDLERRLPSTLTFEHPTIEALTDFLATEILALAAVPATDSKTQVDKQQEKISAEVDAIPEDQLEDALLDELKDAGY